ncbi:MAG TPA: bifunctional [glutamate--ammonia ligase]-adenylyl-L-tyrosine phosphorylase/[glutamate--ammonia-ligase] adenylyltransferase, partial [Nitrospirota bacterium]|nr:bifunctional [glutamate--ammonia ligase]-adenylyl-L-tyrosine phosphorylase/[glutamate--ammonia-ligase] adenylyltransferase [Nitrospirota bacterium]
PRFVSLCREHPPVVRMVITICGASRFLSAFITTDTEETFRVFAEPAYLDRRAGQPALRRRLAAFMKSAGDARAVSRVLRVFRRREMLRIALRDLLGKADLQDTMAELSDLAEVCLQKAYEIAEAELSERYGKPREEASGGRSVPSGFAVIAMGKLGGRDLNFSSDVDLMFVYSSDGETAGTSRQGAPRTTRIANHQYFVKLAERLSVLINEKTEDGFVFRVDVRLRPEGQQGPLALSLGGYETYYESWGQTWERSALIKARPVAGNDAVGREFLERISPFVYRKYLDYSAITEISDMKRKINLDVEQKGRMHRDVKLGYGGIREIEFIIQALQLLYGGRDRLLRERSSLRALHRLSLKGLISYEEQETLAKAYVFLRTVEHRIQLLDDLQSQTMPTDERELRLLARRVGYRTPGREAEQLLREYAEHTERVRRIYDELFSRVGDEETPELPAELSVLLNPDAPEREAVAQLGRAGFSNPDKAYRDLLLLREGPAFVHQTPRSRKSFETIFPPLFREILASADPDQALHHLESFLASHGSWDALQSLAKIDVASVRVLIAVFANSEYLSRLLVSRPDYLQSMLESKKREGAGMRISYAHELGDQLGGLATIAEKLDAIRHFKHQEEIRIGISDLLSGSSLRIVSRDLARLADACLDSALAAAGWEIGKRYGGSGSTDGLAVIAVGKLGGRELTYGSDLDIFFVFSEEHAEAPSPGLSVFERFSKIAEKTISYLTTMTREGFVFRVDTRLRPMGSKGPLVQSVDACRSYYASEAGTWELQALLRARFAAGDRTVGAAFCASVRQLLGRTRDPGVLAGEIRAMRKRIEEELGNEDKTRYNIKQGRGGIVDIEFLVQYFQLLSCGSHPLILIPGTDNGLAVLRKTHLLTDADYRTLRQSSAFLRRLENRMRIISNQTSSILVKDPAALRGLARRMGYVDAAVPAGAQLLADYESVRTQVRSIFNRLLPAQSQD